MNFFKQVLLINTSGVTITIIINSDCKADGG